MNDEFFCYKNLNLQAQSIKPNDKIAIIAPSGRVFPEELAAGIQLIRNWGFIPKTGKYLFEDYYLGYHYAGNPRQRTEDLQNALDDDEIKAVWFARGGYGAVQLIEQINWQKFIRNPKWLIGYSDITAFHNHLNNYNIPTLHALTVKRLNCEYSPETFESLKTVLTTGRINFEIPGHPYNLKGETTGKLVGGNLSLIYSLTGSLSEIKGENLILFIEDWRENWYHLDRMLMNLKCSGLFDRISGMIVGNFTQMDDENENPDFLNHFDPQSYEIIHNFMKNYKIPICFGFPAGHTGDNRALVLGAEIRFKVGTDRVKIEF
jgi:muramoyltetrapeptide carboxypeptidase